MKEAKLDVLPGTGEGADYDDGRLDGLRTREGEEVRLYRALCEAEYKSIVENGNTFVEYDFALEKKWFATCLEHAVKWGARFYPDGVYGIIEATVLRKSLEYMFYAKALDNIEPAYSADIALLNKIVRRLRLL